MIISPRATGGLRQRDGRAAPSMLRWAEGIRLRRRAGWTRCGRLAGGHRSVGRLISFPPGRRVALLCVHGRSDPGLGWRAGGAPGHYASLTSRETGSLLPGGRPASSCRWEYHHRRWSVSLAGPGICPVGAVLWSRGGPPSCRTHRVLLVMTVNIRSLFFHLLFQEMRASQEWPYLQRRPFAEARGTRSQWLAGAGSGAAGGAAGEEGFESSAKPRCIGLPAV